MSTQMKKTALYDEHVRAKGKMVPFAGWELPVQYTSLMDEHLACRNQAALFDVSHMGEFILEGKDAELVLDYLVTNQIKNLSVEQAQYNLFCNESGGIVDDLVVYKLKEDRFLLVVNAATTEKDWDHVTRVLARFEKNHGKKSYQIRNVSSDFSQIALQGPKSEEILKKITDCDLDKISYYHFTQGKVLQDTSAIISRTGYTGEFGYELFVPWSEGPKVWRALLEAGGDQIKPCGLGARDTLRLEMRFHLYGHEMDDHTHPYESKLGWVVKPQKGDFFGKDALDKIKASGWEKELCGLEMCVAGIPREGYKIFSSEDGGEEIGHVTSGTHSPSLKKAIGIAYLKKEFSKIGQSVWIDIRGRKSLSKVVKTPFLEKRASS